jgi:uncharacterized protein (TIGR00369 family)
MDRQAGGGEADRNSWHVRSPFGDFLGITISERGRGFCRLTCLVEAHHLNRGGALHGGVLLALMDHAGGFAGSWVGEDAPERLSVTVDLNGRFTRPVRSGVVSVEARIVGEGRSIYFVSTEIRDEAGLLVAFGSSTHKRLRENNEK